MSRSPDSAPPSPPMVSVIVAPVGSTIVSWPAPAFACMIAARSVHWSPTRTGLASQPASAVSLSGRSISVVLTTYVAAPASGENVATAAARTARVMRIGVLRLGFQPVYAAPAPKRHGSADA